MSSALSRAVLRCSSRSTNVPGAVGRRFESTASKASDAANNTTARTSQIAADYKSKAAEGLSRVGSAAGPAISGAAKGLGNAVGKIGGRTGRLIGFVERQIPPTIYYAKVGLELAKLIFHGQKMHPPPISAFQSYFLQLIKTLQNPSVLSSSPLANPQNILQKVRNMSNAELASSAVLAAELLGFFTVGEIIGRGKLVGYRGETPAAHH